MRTFTKLALVLIVFLSTELNAQVQYGISYQAVLRDASGNALPGKSATIRINVTNKAGTNYYYKETHDITTNSLGIATLVVGKGLPVEGTFASIPWSDGGISMIVELKVSPATTFTPFERQELHGVPYAFHAANGINTNSANAGETAYFDGTNWVANGDIVVTDSSVNIVPKAGHKPEQPIFAVLNSNKEIVFAVYESGVRSYVGSNVTKGAKGGFAVGGLSGSKSNVEYLNISPDSIRVYIDNTSKGAKGGFAVGGLSGSKSTQTNYFKVTADSTYFKNTVLSEGDMLVAGNVTTNVGISSGLLTDILGNKYRTVTLGSQTWMADNLISTQYSNAIPITPTEVFAYNNSVWPDTITNYGLLYTQTAISSGNVCPDGWRIPTHTDWEDLFKFIGGSEWMSNTQELSRKLSEKGTIFSDPIGFWINDFAQTNTTGFSVRPAGYADFSASWNFYMIGTIASFWVDGGAETVQLYGESGGMLTLQNAAPNSANSIRCIKN
ncbi:MAG TPA: fibrobacter succinogenes major paralogous domain-containing protein [Tenuifilaceae bacterium]|nr:fibrobacter succinogenes major paralogous domain-containing protein [Tenuifilaceae bacterium]HPI45621.1 fibrobacter succinogenes major paralogous domain-containing protein [Tenuifilaceae bacterium]HPN21964.1 fibrobacter succinogenes major paralogous domain-containing protein [Tenuifilaceae bacterium]